MRERFRKLAAAVAESVGSPFAFMAALLVIVVWASTGPLFRFGDTWQLVINTGTTIITFLMVFLIQATQNRDAEAIHLKLDELIRALKGARNAFADIEHASDEELRRFAAEFRRLHDDGVDRVQALKKASRAVREHHAEHLKNTKKPREP